MGDFPRTERQAQFIELAERFHDRFAERAEHYDRANEFPFENFNDLRDSGYLALTIPERFGGLGADLLELSLAQERIAHACGSTGLASTMHLSLLGRQGDTRLWPDERYAEIARDVIERGALINATNSEPELGSPSRGALPNTTAVRTPTGWSINGRKSWASLSPALSWVTILTAISDGDTPPERGTILLRADSPGVRVEETWDNLGMRATASHDLIFENVEVPASARVPLEGSDRTGSGTAWWTFPTAAVYLGIATAARDTVVEFAKNRRPSALGGESIATLQTVQHKVAEIDLLLWQTRTLLYDTAEHSVEEPRTRDEQSWKLAALKYTVSNNAIRVTDLAMRVAGSVSLHTGNALQRFHRDARTGLGHPPMDDATLTLLGKTALGLPAPTAEPSNGKVLANS